MLSDLAMNEIGKAHYATNLKNIGGGLLSIYNLTPLPRYSSNHYLGRHLCPNLTTRYLYSADTNIPFPTTHLCRLNNTPNAIPLLHLLKSHINIGKRLTMSDKLVNLQIAIQIVFHKTGKLRPAFDATKCTPPPYATSY